MFKNIKFKQKEQMFLYTSVTFYQLKTFILAPNTLKITTLVLKMNCDAP